MVCHLFYDNQPGERLIAYHKNINGIKYQLKTLCTWPSISPDMSCSYRGFKGCYRTRVLM